jgi:UDPglucose--hexose-1-phosphate uridylyltransferase
MSRLKRKDVSWIEADTRSKAKTDPFAALSARLLKAESTEGKCYVITFSPKHNLTLADMPAQDILPVIETWTKIYTAHLYPQSTLLTKAAHSSSETNGHLIEAPKQQYRYMQIFENKGAAMGCSNPHPHGQVWATTCLPEEPSIELQSMQQYRKDNHDCHLLEDYAKLESEKGERTVFENESFWAGCPWWATWPFEVMVIAKTHKRALTDFNDQERANLAEVMSEITRRYDNLFETNFPYSKLY